MTTVHTLGHATRTFDQLVAVLDAHGIRELVDVRSYPGSKRHPHFARAHLERELPERGVAYRFLGKALGGFRKSGHPESPHVALQDEPFRNYADHMGSTVFAAGIEELLACADRHPVAILCAERDWRRCHRSYVADYLVGVRGAEVVHLLDEAQVERHRIRDTARVERERIVYDRLEQPRLPGF